MSEKLIVFINEQAAGQLEMTRPPDFRFSYFSHYLTRKEAVPISTSLPLLSEPFSEKQSMAFFENLLPEQGVRTALSQSLNIAVSDVFGMLRAVGGECSGAISLLPEGSSPAKLGEYQKLTFKKLETILRSSERAPFQVAKTELRLSLAGAQNKFPIFYRDNTFFLTLNNAPSSHIIKHPHSHFNHTIINELFCMRFAGMLGLNVPDCFKVKLSDKYEIFVIERFDRIRDGQDQIHRLHQEDFCQVFGLDSGLKYESGYHSFKLKNVFDFLVNHSSQVITDRLQLARWLLFNFLIGNRDNHFKNLSLLYKGKSPSLSPFYDLICTTIYPELSSKLAMKIDKKTDPRYLTYKNFLNFFTRIGMKENVLKLILYEFKTRLKKGESLIHEIAGNKEELIFLQKIHSRFVKGLKALDKTA